MSGLSKSVYRGICIAALLQVLGCAGSQPALQTDAAAPGKPVLRVGVCANAPPMIFKQAGQYAGIEAELARGLAAELGMGLRFVDCPWDDLIPSLLGGKFDIIMSGMTITKQRSVRVVFAEPYLMSGQKCLVRNENKNRFATVGTVQYTTMRVGAEQGTTGDFLMQRDLTLAKKTSFSSPEKGAQALMAGKIDMFISDAPIIWWLAATYESKGLTTTPFFLTEEYSAWAIGKDNPRLIDAANRFVDGWKKNGRLRELLQRWMPNAF